MPDLTEDIALDLVEEFARSLMPRPDKRRRDQGVTALELMSQYVVNLAHEVRELRGWRPAIEQANEGMRSWQTASHESAVKAEQYRQGLEATIKGIEGDWPDVDHRDQHAQWLRRLLGVCQSGGCWNPALPNDDAEGYCAECLEA